jgi:uncharacterized protein VirK/YbjX
VAGIETTLRDEETVGEDCLIPALESYMAEASDTLKRRFDMALRRSTNSKYDHRRLILEALTDLPQEGATRAEILAQLRRSAPDYQSRDLRRYLKQLCSEDRGGLLRQDYASGRYSFADPIYRAYALSMRAWEDKKGHITQVDEIGEALKRREEGVPRLVVEIAKMMAEALAKARLPS